MWTPGDPTHMQLVQAISQALVQGTPEEWKDFRLRVWVGMQASQQSIFTALFDASQPEKVHSNPGETVVDLCWRLFDHEHSTKGRVTPFELRMREAPDGQFEASLRPLKDWECSFEPKKPQRTPVEPVDDEPYEGDFAEDLANELGLDL